jgi:hypothetical protein
MYVSSIGIQTIMTTTGTQRQSQSSPQQQDNSRESTRDSELRVTPVQGVGKRVDKSV